MAGTPGSSFPDAPFARLRATSIAHLAETVARNLGDAALSWENAALLWKSNEMAHACSQLKMCESILIGVAGIIVECAGYEMTVTKR
jgi:hypothetical protein